MAGDRKGRPYGFTGALPEIWRAGEDTRPYGGFGSGPFFSVGAGHWPARRYTRRVQEAAPYSPAPAATCSAKPGAVVKPQRLQFLQTQGPVARNETIRATQILRAGSAAKSSRYASSAMGAWG